MKLQLPAMVCFRVTRYCNARCGFCLAPPDGAHPPAQVLMQRLDLLAAYGVRIIHFCGGEPTILPALPALRAARTRVKLSLHGDRTQHDAVVGREAFDLATQHLRSLLAAGIPTAIQTTIVAGGEWVLDWMADFCLALYDSWLHGASQAHPCLPTSGHAVVRATQAHLVITRHCPFPRQWWSHLR